jgi:hypothetical protein
MLALVLQLGVLASRYWDGASDPSSERAGGARLLPAQLQATRLLISDEYDNETVIARRGEHWVLPELLGLPANADKVNAMLAILDTDHLWPVARSTAARQRFQVADYLYQRKLEIASAKGREAVIYLGTSPGFRKVHARNEAHDEILSIALNVHDVPAFPGAWLDPRLLQIRTPVGIDGDSYSLRFENGGWVSGFGGTPNPVEVEALLDTLRTLHVEGVASMDMHRELMDAEAALELRVRGLAGTVTLELFAADDRYFVLSSEYPLFFRLSRYDFDRLTGIDFSRMSESG